MSGTRMVLGSLAVLWALGAANPIGAEPHAPQPGQVPAEVGQDVGQRHVYEIHVKLTGRTSDGQRAVLCEPVLGVVENRPASFHAGGHEKTPENLPLAEPLLSGTRLDLVIFRSKGRLFIDLKGSVTNPSRADSEGLRLTTIGLRLVEPVTLGKRMVVPVQGTDLRWELLVEEIR